MPNRKSQIKNQKYRAFTLVELMISIVLVLLLMIGVSQVFSLTGEAVSAGQTLADNVRSDRAAQSVFFRDISNTASDGPYMLLRSRPVAAFLNSADELSDRDGVVGTADFNGDGTETASAAAVYSHRSHRSDIFTFFARDFYRRQTGNDPDTFIADMASTEAVIWYGHLWLPNNVAAYSTDTLPGAGTAATNPNNRYASQWVLGRVAMLLREPTAGVIADRAGAPQFYYVRPPGPVTEQVLRPLSYNSQPNQAQSTTFLFHSRYDLAGTSIAGFSTILRELLATPSPALTANWWELLMLGAIPTGSTTTAARFRADPFFSVPPTPGAVARQVPLFVPQCSKFIVEYAGDYLNQDINPTSPTYGAITGNAFAPPNLTDGEIDFFIHPDTGERRIRWYGLPRNVDITDDTAAGPVITAGPTSRDVVPLRDFIGGTPAPFEKIGPPSSTTVTMPAAAGNYALTMGPGAIYTCAWGPDDIRPRMIRITMMVEDPDNRLPVGQTFEYVFTLP